MSNVPDPKKTTKILLLLGAVSLAPFLASFLLYYSWKPQTFSNYGELLEVAPLADVAVADRDGKDFRFDELRGKWMFLMVDSGICDEYCVSKLYLMRQIRLTQGKYRDRIERLWLIPDNVRPAPAVELQYPGTRQLMVDADAVLRLLPALRSARDHIYLVDPFGNLMMRFPRDADPQQMKQDVTRLVKVSSGWLQKDD
jgi:cytochrome oxidase Cu insertion factor (SCO1/SenC/PrrC family)